jgi:diguanylate cyclase (GGDEF)-like protein
VGILSLFAKEPGFFNDEELKLLDEVAANISFVLELREKEAKVDFLTLYDPLTGLPNRRLFNERLEQRVSAALRDKKAFSVVLVDLERFGNINESLGRQVGDELLRHVAQRLKNAADETDVVARIGGDHFAIATQRREESARIPHLNEQFLGVAFGQPFEADGRALRLAARAGIAVCPADGGDADSLFRNAEAALRNAKRTGHQYQYYAPEMNARVAERVSIENQLRTAVPEKQFVFHYQPKVDLSSRRVAGFEALIRWSHPDRGLIPPDKFIPILEETGLILDVTRMALCAVAHRHRTWFEQGLEPPRIAVNVSALHLRRPDFVSDVKRAIIEGGDAPESTSIEITETMLMDDLDGNILKLTELRDAGIEIALDDFGTGYSSLAYLARLPISSLKIDRSFVMKIGQSPEYMSIVTTIISLAHAMKFKVVAEGVETEEQANLLRLVRCDEAQGYFFGRPLPSIEAEQLLMGVGPQG